MIGPNVRDEANAAIGAIKKASKTFEGVEREKLIGAEYAKAHQLSELVDALVLPALAEFARFARSSEDRLREIPPSLLVPAAHAMQQVESALSTLQGYSNGQHDLNQIAQKRHSTEEYTRTAIANALGVIEPLRARLFAYTETQLQAKLTELEQLEKDLRSQSALVDTVSAKATSALAQVEQAAARDGLLRQGKEFSDAVNHHRKAAKRWVTFGLALAAAMLLLVGLSMFASSGPPLPTEPWTAAANLGHFSARALGISVLSFLMVMAMRNYRAARHNEVVNAHRASALNTYPQFSAAAHGELQGVILLQATEAVFSTQATGFADGSGDNATTHAGELLRLVRNDSGK